MKQRPLVSVGIPTYNRPDGLRCTLACITGQTYENLEIIVSDNCSPSDETEKVVKEFSATDSRVQYHKHPKNMGPNFNFSFVLRQATGKYFMWNADDDQREPTYISEMVLLLEASKGVSIAFSYFDVHNIATGSTTEKYNEFLLKLPAEELFLRLKQFLLQSSELGKANIVYGLMRREIALKAWNDVMGKKILNDIPWAIDVLYVFYLFNVGNLALKREILVHTSEQPDSLGNKQIKEAINNKAKLYLLLRKYFNGYRKILRNNPSLSMQQKNELFVVIADEEKHQLKWMVFRPLQNYMHEHYIRFRTWLSKYKRKYR